MERRTTRTPHDHQISTAGRCSVSRVGADVSPTCYEYEGDCEEACGEEDSTSFSHPVVDSLSGAHSQQQHARQPHVSKSPHTTNRHHRGYIWGDGEKVTLLVDNKRFIISPNLLTKHPNTMLGRWEHSLALEELHGLVKLFCVCIAN